MIDYSKVFETSDAAQANERLACGWRLLAVLSKRDGFVFALALPRSIDNAIQASRVC